MCIKPLQLFERRHNDTKVLQMCCLVRVTSDKIGRYIVYYIVKVDNYMDDWVLTLRPIKETDKSKDILIGVRKCSCCMIIPLDGEVPVKK